MAKNMDVHVDVVNSDGGRYFEMGGGEKLFADPDPHFS